MNQMKHTFHIVSCAAICLAVFVMLSCNKENPDNPMFDESRLGVCSWSWATDIPTVLKLMEENGIKAMQLATTPWVVDQMSEEQKKDFGDKEPREVLDAIKEEIRLGRISVFSTMVSFPYEEYTSRQTTYDADGFMFTKDKYGHDPKQVWEEELVIMDKAAALTSELGVPYLSTMPGFFSKDWDLALERVKQVCDICSKYGVTLLLEAGQEPASDLAFFLKILENRYSGIKIGISFDPANCLISQSGNPIEAFDTLLPWILQVHVTDGDEDAQWEDCFVAWGKGDISGKYDFLNHVHDSSYDGYLIVEVGSMVDGDQSAAVMSAYNAIAKYYK